MKKSTIILGLSILFANDNNISQEATTENNLSAQKKELEFKKKELELKEKELELKKKELELKEKVLKISQVEPHRDEVSKKINPKSKKELSYFKLAYFSGSVDFSLATDNENYDILDAKRTNGFSLAFGVINPESNNRMEISINQYFIDDINFDSKSLGWEYIWAFDYNSFEPFIGVGLEIVNSKDISEKLDGEETGFGANLELGTIINLNNFDFFLSYELKVHSYVLDSYCPKSDSYCESSDMETIDWEETRSLFKVGLAYKF